MNINGRVRHTLCKIVLNIYMSFPFIAKAPKYPIEKVTEANDYWTMEIKTKSFRKPTETVRKYG